MRTTDALSRFSPSLMRLWTLLLALPLCLSSIGPAQAQSFHYAENCVSNVDNATVLLPSSANLILPDGTSLAPSDTLALRNADGDCAGYGAWSGNDLAVAASGPAIISEAPSGYQDGAPLTFEVYDVSDDRVVNVGGRVAYASCDNVDVATCQDDGTYANGAFFVLDALNASALPVELTDLTAAREDRRVRLEWATAQETNNAGFEVQHRLADESATAWTTIQFVDGAGTTSTPTSYTLKTDPLEVGAHEFRLQQIDQDGSTSLSTTVTVEMTLDEAYRLSPVAPNPVQSEARLSITVRKTQNVTVSMYNVLGQRVATLYDRTLSANQKQDIRIPVQNQSSGSYFLRIEGKTFTDTQRLSVVQ
ncbi:hypothetical protein BSZ35_08280 [Salinibacter sp. 10B]|uniref:T9SS type A sorting domain-containing protein n=1 Tax=Salinibacter sp. 10B TaxID=1923971 RepID=UPI000CF51F19|nr:T9SS type A sorting domain-containing protein [Salinibacter sp. 10B]PQJ34596.1 hypothetical protein BSZ35_08280 [Salinibacter sp. 10B]